MKEFLIILKNMLENCADLRFVWNYRTEEYVLKTLSMDIGAWHISINIDYPILIIHIWEDMEDRSWLFMDWEEMDKIIEVLSESYFDFLLEGIE